MARKIRVLDLPNMNDNERNRMLQNWPSHKNHVRIPLADWLVWLWAAANCNSFTVSALFTDKMGKASGWKSIETTKGPLPLCGLSVYIPLRFFAASAWNTFLYSREGRKCTEAKKDTREIRSHREGCAVMLLFVGLPVGLSCLAAGSPCRTVFHRYGSPFSLSSSNENLQLCKSPISLSILAHNINWQTFLPVTVRRLEPFPMGIRGVNDWLSECPWPPPPLSRIVGRVYVSCDTGISEKKTHVYLCIYFQPNAPSSPPPARTFGSTDPWISVEFYQWVLERAI